jgi:hypothetical protein
MPLATKNNAIIVKDGLLAESCGCCSKAGCQQGSPFLPGAQSASIKVTLANITPAFSSAVKKSSSKAWLDFLGAFPSNSHDVEIPLYLDWTGSPAYSNNMSYSGEIVIQLITKKNYNSGSNEREFPPSAFGYESNLRCLYRHEYFTNSYEVRMPGTTTGVLVPAYSVNWQVNDGVFVFVKGSITGAINFAPTGINPTEWAAPRFSTLNEPRLTAGGFSFSAGFAYRGFPDTQTLNSQTSTNLFASEVAGTTYDWQYDITLSMQ